MQSTLMSITPYAQSTRIRFVLPVGHVDVGMQCGVQWEKNMIYHCKIIICGKIVDTGK